jgi:hypothetical protein
MDTSSVSFTPFAGVLDNLSSAAKTAMLGTGKSAGALGINRLYSSYTGPTIQIKNGTGGTATDFYPVDTSGNLATSTGTTLATFLNGSQAYVTKWYDQTGNGNHATASTGVLPKYDVTNKRIDFTSNTAGSQSASTNAYFTLQNGAFPYGTGDYSYIMKMGTYYGSSIYPLYSAGTYGAITSMTVLANFNGTSGSALDSWFSNNATVPNGTYTNNCVASTTYATNGAYTRNWYVTGKSTISISGSGAKNISNTNNFIGTGIFNGGTYQYNFYIGHIGFFYWAPISLSDSDRNILEATTVFY